MAARFLYGDSEPFPGGYDFLAALKDYVSASSRVLALSHEADELERSLGDRAQEHLHALDALQHFFTGLSDVIAERAARSPSPQIVGPYASQLIEQVEALAAQARATRAKELDGQSVEVTSHIRERRAEIRKIVAEYLLADPLPVLSWAVSLNLAGTAPSGQVMLVHPAEITTSFAIDVARDPTWSRARRVGDISPGLTLQVGFKKAFLRSSLQPDVVVFDEMVIGGLELGPDSMEIRLRRKLDAPRDAFVITVDPDEQGGGSTCRITRFDERGGGASEPFVSQDDEARRIVELFTVLRGECSALLAHKKRLLAAQIDGHDVFERSLAPLLFQRIADRLAPIAAEVSRRSPNPNELSLKYERGDGRREELYLRKADLIAMVAALPREMHGFYAPLAFMPTASASPPLGHRPQLQVVAESQVQVVEAEPVRSSAPPSPPKPSGPPPPPRRKW